MPSPEPVPPVTCALFCAVAERIAAENMNKTLKQSHATEVQGLRDQLDTSISKEASLSAQLADHAKGVELKVELAKARAEGAMQKALFSAYERGIAIGSGQLARRGFGRGTPASASSSSLGGEFSDGEGAGGGQYPWDGSGF